LDHAPGHTHHLSVGIPFDPLADEQIGPGPQAGPAGFPKALRFAKGFSGLGRVGRPAIGAEQQPRAPRRGLHLSQQVAPQHPAPLYATDPSQPQAGTHLDRQGQPDHSSLRLYPQLIRLHLAQVPGLLDQMLLHSAALRPSPPLPRLHRPRLG